MATTMPSDDSCEAPGCTGLMPLDMVGIIFAFDRDRDKQWLCSPECARNELKRLESPPQTITLHDPQFAVDRDEFTHVGNDAIDIQATISTTAEAFAVIDDFESLCPRDFRPTPK